MRKRKEDKEIEIRNSRLQKGITQVGMCEIGELVGCDETIEPHRHDYYHIMYVRNGKGQHTIDFCTYEIKENSIFFISPGQIHSMEFHGEFEGCVLTFDSEFYNLSRSKSTDALYLPFFHAWSSSPLLYLGALRHDVEFLFHELLFEFQAKSKSYLDLMRALIDVLLLRLSREIIEHKTEQIGTSSVAQLRKVEELIETHFKTHKPVSDYASMMNISVKQINTLCKRILNKTMSNLIHERMVLEAKRMLLFTDNSVEAIAYNLGYEEKSYFMRFFKKQTNKTCEEFRLNV